MTRRRAPSNGSLCAGWLAWSAVLMTATLASADPPLARASLSYDRQPGAEACPEEPTLREQVALRLGYDPFRDGAAHHISVSIAPRPKGLHARIKTFDASASVGGAGSEAGVASRELDSDDERCDELLQSVVLAVSLAIDPRSFARTPAPALAPALTLVPAPAPAPAPSPSSPWTVELTGAGRVGFGLVPGVSVGPVIELSLGQKRWALIAVGGADLPTSSATVAASGGPGVEASLIRGGAGGCSLFSWLSLCGRVDLGALQGSGTGQLTATAKTTLYADIALAAGLSVPVFRGIHAMLGVELVAPLVRTDLYVKSVAPWETPTLAGSLDLGIGYRF